MKRHLSRIIFCCFLPALLAGCASLPASRTTEEIASPNFDQRKPNYVILHHTGSDNADRALRTLTSAESRVSAHYLIDRDGKTIQLVEESARAWHAGKSYWGGNTDMNSVSVGIELDNNGSEPFAEAQIEALLILLADLKQHRPCRRRAGAQGRPERLLPVGRSGAKRLRSVVREPHLRCAAGLRPGAHARRPRLRPKHP